MSAGRSLKQGSFSTWVPMEKTLRPSRRRLVSGRTPPVRLKAKRMPYFLRMKSAILQQRKRCPVPI